MSEKLYSSAELNKTCELYAKLVHYDDYASSFISARNKGLETSFNSVKGEVQTLINKINNTGLNDEPLFKKIIPGLIKSYELDK